MRVIARSVSQRFAGHPFLFENLDFILMPGRVYALTGPSGSGKTTLLTLIAGWLEPTEGSIVREDVRQVAWVFQNPHGVASRTALDHVIVPMLAAGLSHHEARLDGLRLLRQVGLEDVAQSPFRQLSGGEAQRLMLIRGMASKPDVLLVDEPTAQLDAHTADTVNSAMTSLVAEGTIVVVATHDKRTQDACTDLIDLSGAS